MALSDDRGIHAGAHPAILARLRDGVNARLFCLAEATVRPFTHIPTARTCLEPGGRSMSNDDVVSVSASQLTMSAT